MAYPPILVDQDGNPIPQRWDPVQQKWVPYDARVQLSGRIETTTPDPGVVEPEQRITVETFDCEDFDRFRVAYNVQSGAETETRYLEVSMANEATGLTSDSFSLVRFYKIPHTSLGDNSRARVSDGDIPLYGRVCRIYAYNGSSESTWPLITGRIVIKKVRR